MKRILSAKMWSFELHALCMNVPSLVRIVVTGAVLVEKVGVGAVDCVCSQEQNARRDGLPGSFLTVLRPCQYSLASCKRLLTTSELCEGRPCRCGGVMCSVCVLCCVCACVYAGRRGQWARGSGTCTGEWGKTWRWCFSGEGGPWLGARSRAGRESCLKLAVCMLLPAPPVQRQGTCRAVSWATSIHDVARQCLLCSQHVWVLVN